MPTKNELAKAASKYISTKKVSKPSAAKKDSTRVARTRVNELVGDKPTYEYLKLGNPKPTKRDSLNYEAGFRNQIMKNKKAGKTTSTSFNLGSQSTDSGMMEANIRRDFNELSKKAMVRDSSIPLAPTQFPD
jgi:hypothetical protein